MATNSQQPLAQPKFHPNITNLYFPVGSSNFGKLQRGYMLWEKATIGYSEPAAMNFLYNPSTVTADYYMAPDLSVQGSLMFPTGFDSTYLRVPLNQTVTWSLLFDRTYELWHSYNAKGKPLYDNYHTGNNPAVVGVMADIMQMQQFTGMRVGYSIGDNSSTATQSVNNNQYQGIIQLIPSYVYFGGSKSSMWFYGYVSEWDVTVTHWTQFMIPMRCVINITFTLMPTPAKPKPVSTSNTYWTLPGSGGVKGVGTPTSGPGGGKNLG